MKNVFLSFVIPWQDFKVALNRGPTLGSAGRSPWHRGKAAISVLHFRASD